MSRETFVNFRGHLLTPDTARATETLLVQLMHSGWVPQLEYGQEDEWSPLSLQLAGREISIHVTCHDSQADEQDCLNALWGHAVPLGFTPWTRYPLAGSSGSSIFHFLGPWAVVYDSLLSEGRGHQAWPSTCAAAQVDVGVWAGSQPGPRFVQAQLHRIGIPCGPLDGVIGPRTLAALAQAGLAGVTLQQATEHLKQATTVGCVRGARQYGHLALPGRPLTLTATGAVKATRTPAGASLTVDGPGQLVVVIGEPS